VTDQRLKQIRFTAQGILDGKEWRIQPQDVVEGKLVEGRPVDNLDEHWAGIEAVLAR